MAMSNDYTAKEIEENISKIHKKIKTATSLIDALEESAKTIEASRIGIDQSKTMFMEHREKTTRFLTDNQEKLIQIKKETEETLDHATSTLKKMIDDLGHEVDSTLKTLKQTISSEGERHHNTLETSFRKLEQTIEKHSNQINQEIDLKTKTLMDDIEKITINLNDLVSEYRKTTRENMEVLSHRNKVQSIVLFTLLLVSIIISVLSIVIN